ncbi:protein kinase family protein [Streptomyces qinzhouensis]|uniref:Protein kinase family protein n=1 Tax=Streptomyces qinzhouensis TaxID=2599401 RepID=A0A5B8JAZ8_9ACTN|nr:protein kinase family protein [Streptomyces qinzhouensis]QDY78557.1 protein kinase family protein [Streptomyces qinzhouensis]
MPSDSPAGERLRAYRTAATALALHDDRRLAALLETARPLGSGIGGTSALLDVDGTPVFVKRVPLTDTKRAPGHRHSTADLFGLPLNCQYGMSSIGSPGFGAWRELAVHTMTTNWVLTGAYGGFPLMYHWRTLPGAAAPPGELADVERAVDHWGGGPGVRRRIEELRDAAASLVLFLEYVPRTLHDWLGEAVDGGGEGADEAVRRTESQLADGIRFLAGNGLLHFDSHFRNILTDGRRLYFADFGLALATRFDLSAEERAFAARHRDHDAAYTMSYLVNWLITAVHGHGRQEREDLIRACAAGAEPPAGPEAVREVIRRHAATAAVVTDFYGSLLAGALDTPFPAEELDRILRGGA